MTVLVIRVSVSIEGKPTDTDYGIRALTRTTNTNTVFQ
jgi:hypothetical protein